MQIEGASRTSVIDKRSANEIIEGMRAIPKRIPSKYLYDEKGSALFDEICELPEYYLTRTESAIMNADVDEIVDAIGPNAVILELGSGSSTKTRTLLDNIRQLRAYVPIDISGDHLHKSADQLQSEYPSLTIEPVVADYTREIELPRTVATEKRRVVYFPGSTFGNFHPDEGLAFLKRMRNLAGDKGGLLIGLDWRKEASLLEAAYNDSRGVTAAFNLNILSNVNRLTGADFDEAGFKHFAFFDDPESRIEIYLVSRRDQSVRIAGRLFQIEADEAILTEVSYKHRPEDFLGIAARANFTLRKSWTDPDRWFGILYLSAS